MSGNQKLLRLSVGIACAVGLIFIFLFQRFDLAGWMGLQTGNTARFVVNRSIRFLLNDLFAIGLIFALFYERKYMIFAIVVQVIGMVVFLIPYFLLKIEYPGYNGPMISFLHRLVLNPTLLLLLIPAFYVQKHSPTQKRVSGD